MEEERGRRRGEGNKQAKGWWLSRGCWSRYMSLFFPGGKDSLARDKGLVA